MILENCELKWNFRMQLSEHGQYSNSFMNKWIMPWDLSPMRNTYWEGNAHDWWMFPR